MVGIKNGASMDVPAARNVVIMNRSKITAAQKRLIGNTIEEVNVEADELEKAGPPKEVVRLIRQLDMENKHVEATEVTKTTLGEVVYKRLRKLLDEHEMLDISKGAAEVLGIPDATLSRIVWRLEEDGFKKFYVPVKNSQGKTITAEVLGRKEFTYVYVLGSLDKVYSVGSNLIKDIEGRKHLFNSRTRTASRLNYQIRTMKKNGYSNVAIGEVMGISESTVRRRLKAPMAPEEALMEDSLSYLVNAREQILADVENHTAAFKEVFPEYQDTHVLRINTNSREVEVNTKARSVWFKLSFSATLVEKDEATQ